MGISYMILFALGKSHQRRPNPTPGPCGYVDKFAHSISALIHIPTEELARRIGVRVNLIGIA
jgi:hypothetical protein